MELNNIINNICPLSADINKLMCQHFEHLDLQKGATILSADKTEKHLYFVKNGLVRAFTDFEGQEVTFWFGTEGQPIIPMNSYVYNKKNYENIELLEDCSLYKIEIIKLQKLYKEYKEIANWGRILAEKELVATERRLITRISMQAKDRYLELLAQHPNLLQRAALRHIASYLGITQVSLSRIRAQIK